MAVVTSENGVVAADHETCSEIGANVLRRLGGTAVDAAVAVAFSLGVLNPSSSGIGGGSLMVVGSSASSVATAYDMRETAPLAASQDTFENREAERIAGPLSIAVPGEIAGLYKAWETHGRVPWKLLVEPSIKLARDGFEVGSHLDFALSKNEAMIKNDTGLKSVFTKEGELLKKGDICYNTKLAETLQVVAEKGMKAFYEEDVAEKLVNDVREAGGIITMEDLRSYEVKVTDAMVVDDVMGYKIYGMWPPACGTTGFAMIMNVLERYMKVKATDENLRLHRLVEVMKHMLAARMDLGDPAFVDGIANAVDKLLSKSYAGTIQKKISDNTTFPPEYYLNKYNQLEDQGTTHFCVVDKDRNAVSMTTTVNYAFGSGFMSPSTGIILNGQMEDFAIPTLVSSYSLPPAPTNYIAPKKRALGLFVWGVRLTPRLPPSLPLRPAFDAVKSRGRDVNDAAIKYLALLSNYPVLTKALHSLLTINRTSSRQEEACRVFDAVDVHSLLLLSVLDAVHVLLWALVQNEMKPCVLYDLLLHVLVVLRLSSLVSSSHSQAHSLPLFLSLFKMAKDYALGRMELSLGRML
ncbi:hypothetical protein Bca4012_015355 [Brassica carinata]